MVGGNAKRITQSEGAVRCMHSPERSGLTRHVMCRLGENDEAIFNKQIPR